MIRLTKLKQIWLDIQLPIDQYTEIIKQGDFKTHELESVLFLSIMCVFISEVIIHQHSSTHCVSINAYIPTYRHSRMLWH